MSEQLGIMVSAKGRRFEWLLFAKAGCTTKVATEQFKMKDGGECEKVVCEI